MDKKLKVSAVAVTYRGPALSKDEGKEVTEVRGWARLSNGSSYRWSCRSAEDEEGLTLLTTSAADRRPTVHALIVDSLSSEYLGQICG